MMTENTTPAFLLLRVRLWGLITAAGAVAGAASIIGFLGAYHWLFDLCSHFRVQYCLGLGAAATLLLIPRKLLLASLFGALAAVNLCTILPMYFGRAPVPAAAGQPVRAMLCNVNTRTGRVADVAAVIRRFNPDIVVLEEVSAKWMADLEPVMDGYRYSQSEPREDNFGIALWSKFPFTGSRIVNVGSAGVPTIIAEVDTMRGKCTVVATHPLPPGGREYSELGNGQLAELPRWVREVTSPAILLGDLNVTPWSHYFKRLLHEADLKDSALGRGVRPTWPTFSPLLRIPIDHCLYSHGIAIADRQIGPKVGSDHFPLIVDFVIQ